MYCNDYFSTFLVQSSVLYVECKTSILQSKCKLKQYRLVAHTHSAGGGGDRSTQTTMNSNLAASDVPQPGGGRGHSHPHNHHLLHSHLNLHFVFCKQYWVVQSNNLCNRHRQHYFVKNLVTNLYLQSSVHHHSGQTGGKSQVPRNSCCQWQALACNRQHCHLKICRYIGWVDKYCIRCQKPKSKILFW